MAMDGRVSGVTSRKRLIMAVSEQRGSMVSARSVMTTGMVVAASVARSW